MKHIVILSLLELKRMTRNQMFWFVSLLSVFLLFLMDMFNYFTIEEQLKMIKDFSLGLMNLTALFLVVYYPVSMVKDEFREKTIFSLLAAPVTRTTFILGKALAMTLLIGITLSLNYVSLIIMVWVKGGRPDLQLFWAVVLIFLKNLSLLGFAFLFAVLPLSNMICTLLTFFVYCIGSVKSYFLSVLDHDHGLSSQITWLHKVVFSLFPNFRIFDLVENITLGNQVTSLHMLNCFLHFIGVSILVYGMTLYIFNRREI